MADVPAYLEAPDNEDSEGLCECGDPVDDDGRYPDLCWQCNDEAAREEYWDDMAERLADREMFPEDYDYDHGGY